jgi:ribosomal protein L12E/L44/L45/RPP1/RPP2
LISPSSSLTFIASFSACNRAATTFPKPNCAKNVRLASSASFRGVEEEEKEEEKEEEEKEEEEEEEEEEKKDASTGRP